MPLSDVREAYSYAAGPIVLRIPLYDSSRYCVSPGVIPARLYWY